MESGPRGLRPAGPGQRLRQSAGHEASHDEEEEAHCRHEVCELGSGTGAETGTLETRSRASGQSRGGRA